jgi:hypothetical protein
MACVTGFIQLMRSRHKHVDSGGDLRLGFAFAGALFIAWLFPTLSRYGNPFIGSTFAAIILLVGVLLLSNLFTVDRRMSDDSMRRPGVGGALGWSVVVLSVLVFQWPTYMGSRSSEWIAVDNRVERAIYRTLTEHNVANRPATVFVTSAANLSSDLLQFRALVAQIPLTVTGPPFSSDLAKYHALIASSDYVVTGDQGAFRENIRLPFYPLQNTLVAELKADPTFTLLATVPTHDGLNIYIFGRKRS